ncbi:Tetratricopeptide-like helical domain superfamily [Sesbania bispinosa]|nr:Tetratricopeptide-like helical domain superfamily [Sesbania bispinosa]
MATAAALFPISAVRVIPPSSICHVSLLSPPSSSPPAFATPHSPPLALLGAFRTRAFSTRSSNDRESETDSFHVDSPIRESETDSFGIDSLVVNYSFVYFGSQNCSSFSSGFNTSQDEASMSWLEAEISAKVEGKLLHSKVPCFFLWMVSIRKMSLNGHPGFDCRSYIIVLSGDIYMHYMHKDTNCWFIFPFLIAGLHYIIVQISFRKPLVEESTRGIFDILAKYYKRYLDFLTLPIAFIGFCIPQGSQLYWITNSSLTLIQHVTLRHPAVLAKLGLLDKNSQEAASEEIGRSKTTPSLSPLDSPEKWQKIPIEDMSPKELTALSIPFLSSEDKESAIPLLKLALDKDPEYVRALVLMGRVLFLKHVDDEAKEYFERAISKLSLAGQPTDAEDVDLLILSSQWAGVACERQGKKAEGRAHFERVANMEEPEDPTSKGYYFDGLLLLASTLFDAGQKAEAAKYLRRVVAYKPAYKKFLEQCEQDEDFASDLARSRREL